MRLDENGMLNAVTARGNRIHAYDRRGVLLSTERYKDPDVFAAIAMERRSGFADGQGRRYVVRNELWSPRVHRIGPNGKSSLEVATPALLKPFICPFPCWFTILVAGVLHHWNGRRRTRHAGEDEKLLPREAGSDLRLARSSLCVHCGARIRMRSFRLYRDGRPTECPACGNQLQVPAQ